MKGKRFERGWRIKDIRGKQDAGLMHLYRQNNKAARRVVDKMINYMEADMYNNMKEDGG